MTKHWKVPETPRERGERIGRNIAGVMILIGWVLVCAACLKYLIT